MPSIELKVDTTQAQSNVESLKRSMEGYIGSVQELANQGKYTEAAQQLQQMAGQQSVSLMQQAGINPGNAGVATSLIGNTNNQQLKTLDSRLESVNRTIEELTKQLEASTKAGEYKNSSDIASSLNSAEQERARLEREKLLEENGGKEKKEDGISKYFGMKEISQAMSLAFQGMGIQANYRQNIANGNYEEAEVNKTRSRGELAGNAISAVGGAMMLVPGLQIVGGLSMLLGQGLKGAFDLWGANKEANIAESNAYESMFPYTHGLNKLYASGYEGVATNRANAIDILEMGTEKARGTNLSIQDFLSSVTAAAKYGYTGPKEAMEATRNAALFAYGTGADLGSVQSLMGVTHRYGKEDISADTLNRERVVSGLSRSQTGEFLSSLQKVIEAGISDGYIKSSEDVVKTFSMFNTLTGGENEFWKGEQGANRILRMGEGISSATGLNDVNDMLTFQAAQNVLGGMSDAQRADIGANTGSYVDTMLLMERGLDTNMFKEIAETVNAMEGGNAAGQIERFRGMYNLNYTGAAEVYKMSQKGLAEGWSDDKFAEEMQKIQEKPEYKSEETQKQDVINDIQKDVALIGGTHHDEVMKALFKIAGEYEDKADGKKEVPDNTYYDRKAKPEDTTEVVNAYKTAEKGNKVRKAIEKNDFGDTDEAKAFAKYLADPNSGRDSIGFDQAINSYIYEANNGVKDTEGLGRIINMLAGNEDFMNIYKNSDNQPALIDALTTALQQGVKQGVTEAFENTSVELR